MSDRSVCSYPTCGDVPEATVRFDDDATADYCGPHAERALERYAGAVDSAPFQSEADDG